MSPIDHLRRIALPPAAVDEMSSHSERDSLNAEPPTSSPQTTPRQAAVLIPFIERQGELSILLTRRSHNLPQHRGQIAFPGGKIDKTDKSHIAAAVRETNEEIGADPARIEIFGKLPLYETSTGFIITPVIARLLPPYDFVKEQGEVDEIFEVPLPFILNLENFERRSLMVETREREFWALPYGEYFIWGATAAILIDLAERFTAVRPNLKEA
ncbi:MAG: hypothetical protein DHS20C08_01890 [Rhodomicrobium sp.]|nr:MAG: hypothetical protein DHS20C08_01890 [Rhodomicrobium sp.]